MKRLALIALAISLAGSVQARLMETKEQLVKRYGQPVDGSRQPVFRKDNLVIKVQFGERDDIQGRSSVEGLVIAELVTITDGEFSDQAKREILAANGGGSAWGYEPPNSRPNKPAWADLKNLPELTQDLRVITKDGRRTATLGRASIELRLVRVTKPLREAPGY